MEPSTFSKEPHADAERLLADGHQSLQRAGSPHTHSPLNTGELRGPLAARLANTPYLDNEPSQGLMPGANVSINCK